MTVSMTLGVAHANIECSLHVAYEADETCVLFGRCMTGLNTSRNNSRDIPRGSACVQAGSKGCVERLAALAKGKASGDLRLAGMNWVRDGGSAYRK